MGKVWPCGTTPWWAPVSCCRRNTWNIACDISDLQPGSPQHRRQASHTWDRPPAPVLPSSCCQPPTSLLASRLRTGEEQAGPGAWSSANINLEPSVRILGWPWGALLLQLSSSGQAAFIIIHSLVGSIEVRPRPETSLNKKSSAPHLSFLLQDSLVILWRTRHKCISDKLYNHLFIFIHPSSEWNWMMSCYHII